MNRLYFGDNLDILREHIADESVDLIYRLSSPSQRPPRIAIILLQ